MLLGPDGRPASPDAPKKSRAEFDVGFKPEQMDAWAKWAKDHVAKDGDGLADEILAELLTVGRMILERAKKPPRGRNGLLYITKALATYRDTMGSVLGALERRRSKKAEIAKASGQLAAVDSFIAGEIVNAQETGPRAAAGRREPKRHRSAPRDRAGKKRPAARVVEGPVGVPDGEGPGRPPGQLDEG